MADPQTPPRNGRAQPSEPASTAKEPAALAASTQKKVVQQLEEIVRGVTAPFACGGTEKLRKKTVTVRFGGQGEDAKALEIQSPAKPEKPAGASWDWSWKKEACKMQVEKLKELTDAMPQAAFGHGSQTKYDASVRDALQLQAADFDIDIGQALLNSVLAQVREGLQIEAEIAAERYSLNVYREKGKFLKHKDTPRGDDMLGTLVMCLPSFYTGGAIRISQGMKVHSFFDGGSTCDHGFAPHRDSMPSRSKITWCAFFADIDHEIKEVTGGLRVTVAYLLRRKDSRPAGDDIPRPLTQPQQYAGLANLLRSAVRDRSFIPNGGKLGFPCFHLYTNDEVFPGGAVAGRHLDRQQLAGLKGRDAVIGRAAAALGLPISLVPFLAHDYSEECGGEYRLTKFPDRKHVPRRMSDSTIERHFRTEGLVESYEKEAIWVLDISKGAKKNAGETEWNENGYFGNEASDITFYVKAALFVHIPSAEARQQQLSAAEVKPEDLGLVKEDKKEEAGQGGAKAAADREAAEEDSGSGSDEECSEFYGSELEDDECPLGDDSEYGESDLDSDEAALGLMSMVPPRILAAMARSIAGALAGARPEAKAKAKAEAKAKAKAKAGVAAPSKRPRPQ